MTGQAKSASKPWWQRLRRPRLTSGLLTGLGVFALLLFVADVSWRLRFITAWDIGVTFTMVLLYFGLRRASAATMKENAIRQDAGKWAVLGFTLLAATASLVVITSETPLVKSAEGLEQIARVLLVIYTVVLSWAFMHTIFALHYAHDYYLDVAVADAKDTAPSHCLIFPGKQAPGYSDFLYFAFTIGMTFQVSDVQITDPEIRRVALGHGIAAFFYTTGILALAISLVASLV
jgi:uncharacterized membrane protein